MTFPRAVSQHSSWNHQCLAQGWAPEWTANGVNKPSLPWPLFLFAFSQVVPSVWNTPSRPACMAHLPTLGRHWNMASWNPPTQEGIPSPGPGVCPAIWTNNSRHLFSQPFPGFCTCSSKQPLLNHLLDWEMPSTPPFCKTQLVSRASCQETVPFTSELPSWHLFRFPSFLSSRATCLEEAEDASHLLS